MLLKNLLNMEAYRSKRKVPCRETAKKGFQTPNFLTFTTWIE